VQVDPIKAKLNPPGTERLKLECDIRVLLSTSAFNFNLRRYNMGDLITLSTAGPELQLYTSEWFRMNHVERWPLRPFEREPQNHAHADDARFAEFLDK
jgi:hypothetical protein